MSAKLIPAQGSHGDLGEPFPTMVAHVSVGPGSDNDVVATSTGVYNLFSIDPGPDGAVVVHGVKTQVKTAFTGSVTFTIGDSDDVDGYGTDTLIAPASTGAALLKAATALAEGKQYTAAQTIDAVLAGTTALAGEMDVFITYSRKA